MRPGTLLGNHREPSRRENLAKEPADGARQDFSSVVVPQGKLHPLYGIVCLVSIPSCCGPSADILWVSQRSTPGGVKSIG